jgi:CRISPR-associated protein Cas5d
MFAPLSVTIWGELACFTRPETKVERHSYDVITPSAARMILENIFWKPDFEWRIREIWVLTPIQFLMLTRNEVKSVLSVAQVQRFDESGDHYYAADDRTQRQTRLLRDVAYVVRADIELLAHAQADAAKYRDQFRRRVKIGQYFRAPYLGCREFPASFRETSERDKPLHDLTRDLGRMLFDQTYATNRSGHATPHFFAARLESGILRIDPSLYPATQQSQQSTISDNGA